MDKKIEMRFEKKFEDILAMKPVIVLKSVSTDQILHIWIGEVEGEIINAIIHHNLPPRPITHVLIKQMIDACEMEIKSVIITDLKKNRQFFGLFRKY